MTHFDAYLLTRLDSFCRLFDIIICILICILFVILAINFIVQIICLFGASDAYSKDEQDKWAKNSKKVFSYFKFTVPCFIIVLLLKSLIPSTKEAAFIYIAPAIVNNQDLQKTIKKIPELSGLGLEYLGEILKEEIKESKKEIKEEIKEIIKK